MGIITVLTRGYEGYSRNPGWNDTPAPTRDKTTDQDSSTGGIFSFMYKAVDPGTGWYSTLSLLLEREDAISLECVLKKEIAQHGRRCETYHYGNVTLTCNTGSMPLISFPNRSLSFRLMKYEDYNILLGLLADSLYDADVECLCEYEPERD